METFKGDMALFKKEMARLIGKGSASYSKQIRLALGISERSRAKFSRMLNPKAKQDWTENDAKTAIRFLVRAKVITSPDNVMALLALGGFPNFSDAEWFVPPLSGILGRGTFKPNERFALAHKVLLVIIQQESKMLPPFQPQSDVTYSADAEPQTEPPDDSPNIYAEYRKSANRWNDALDIDPIEFTKKIFWDKQEPIWKKVFLALTLPSATILKVFERAIYLVTPPKEEEEK